MTLDELSKLRYFALEDIVKIKLWTFSSISVCEDHVRNVMSRCFFTTTTVDDDDAEIEIKKKGTLQPKKKK